MFSKLFTGNWLSIFSIIFLLTMLFGVASASATQLAQEPCSRAEHFKHYRRIGDACRLPNGLLRVKLANGKVYQTHGVDGPNRFHEPEHGAHAEAATPFVCATDNRRVMAIYAYPSDGTNRSSTFIPYVRQQFQQSNDMMSNTAANFGISLSLKAACDTDGQLTVRVVQMGFTRSQASISMVANDLNSKGYNVAGQKNWIWFDGDTCGGGVAFGLNDDRPGVENQANNATGYAVVWGRCPYTYSLHEGTHSMGAVVSTTPNSSGAGHCNDDSDVMCYNDGGPRSNLYRNNICPSGGLDDFYDCHNDDYFHPSPPAGSYLATHWNVGGCNNLLIVRSGCGGTSPTPTRTNTPVVNNTPTRTPTPGGPTPTRTNTPNSFTPTRTPTPNAFTPTRTPTPGSGTACNPVTSTISVPFTFDGAGTFCWQASSLGAYVNSWNTNSVTINGATFTNVWVGSGSYPAPIGGFYYVGYNSGVAWGHLEVR